MADRREYDITVTWIGKLPDAESTLEINRWMATLPSFGVGVAAHGDARTEAIANAEALLDVVIAAYQAQGLALPSVTSGG